MTVLLEESEKEENESSLRCWLVRLLWRNLRKGDRILGDYELSLRDNLKTVVIIEEISGVLRKDSKCKISSANCR